MLPKSFKNLITHFAALPGVGPRMAERLAVHLWRQDARTVTDFAAALTALTALERCTRCGNIADGDLCAICADTSRDTTLLCVVEDPLDIVPIERTGGFHGLYHVLGGTIAHGPDTAATNAALTVDALLARVRADSVQEVILATNPTTAGDATALYIRSRLGDTTVSVSRLARGLATGADIEYADDITLRSALTRRERL